MESATFGNCIFTATGSGFPVGETLTDGGCSEWDAVKRSKILFHARSSSSGFPTSPAFPGSLLTQYHETYSRRALLVSCRTPQLV